MATDAEEKRTEFQLEVQFKAVVESRLQADPHLGYRKLAKELGIPQALVERWGKNLRKAPVKPTASQGGAAGDAVEERYRITKGRIARLRETLGDLDQEILDCRAAEKYAILPQLHREARMTGKELAELEEELREARAAAGDTGNLTEAELRQRFETYAGELPEPHIRIFVDEYLRRHRMVLAPDASAKRKVET